MKTSEDKKSWSRLVRNTSESTNMIFYAMIKDLWDEVKTKFWLNILKMDKLYYKTIASIRIF